MSSNRLHSTPMPCVPRFCAPWRAEPCCREAARRIRHTAEEDTKVMRKHERRQQGTERGIGMRMPRRLFASGGANLPAATILGLALLGMLAGCAKPPVAEPTLPRDESAASESPPPPPGMAIPPSMLERAAAGQPVSDPNEPAPSPAEPAPSSAEPAGEEPSAPETPKEAPAEAKPAAPAAKAPAQEAVEPAAPPAAAPGPVAGGCAGSRRRSAPAGRGRAGPRSSGG